MRDGIFGLARLGAALRTRLLKQSTSLNPEVGFEGTDALIIAPPQQWTAFHVPVAATVATATRALRTGDYGAVITAISAQLIIPPGVNQPILTLDLIANATTYFSERFGVGAAVANGLVQSIRLTGLNIALPNTGNPVLAFSGAGAATTLQSVFFSGYDLAP